MNIIIAGDLFPTPSNYEYFKNGEIVALMGQELCDEWMEADFRIFNLETALTNTDTPIQKRGAAFSAPLYTMNGIKALNPQLVCTANNHIYDHGEIGYATTTMALNANNIPYVGSGNTLKQSEIPHIIDGKKKIGVYACADYEFSIATDNSPGANPFDPVESYDHIYELKQKCDYLIVIYHGGKEYYRYPSPYTQKICRKMADKGADIILLQHSHCIGCKEEYNDTTIIYGQGNFIFDRRNDEYAYSSLLVRINIEDRMKIDYIPIVKIGNKIRLANEAEVTEIIGKFQERTEQIKTERFVEVEYDSFCRAHYSYYLENALNIPPALRKVNHALGCRLFGHGIKREYLMFLKNILTCDAHREVFINSINIEIQKRK